jgi:hypothetical protein
LIYKKDKLCVLKGEILHLIKQAHTLKVVGHFCVGNMVDSLQRYVYWPRMQEDIALYIRGCMLCCIRKPSNRNKGIYHPLLVPTRPWESISMDFVGRFPTTMRDMAIYLW